MLTAAESIVTYRRRYQARYEPASMLELVLSDAGNPRSVAYQLEHLVRSVEHLPRGVTSRRSDEEKLALEASTLVAVAEPDELAAVQDTAEGTSARPALAGLLDELDGLLQHAGDAIAATHFPPLPDRQLLVGPLGSWEQSE